MALVPNTRGLTVAEAVKRGVEGLVADAENGADLVVTRRQRPVAAVISYQRLTELEDTLANLQDLALVLTRTGTDTGERTSLDDVLRAFGHTRESLAALPDDE